MIKLENVSKSYGNAQALKNINIEISRGEIIGLLGPNGAGKTTAMRIICSYIRPDSGRVMIGGYDTQDQSFKTKAMIGYLPENVPVYPEMRVMEFLRYRASLKSVQRSKVKTLINNSMKKCGVTEVSDKIIGHLSKGFTQRVGLADALLAEPEILVLDEPTSGLDPAQRIQVRNIIKELGKDRTIIVSTHILSEVENTCETAIIINKGEIIAREKILEIKSISSEKGFEFKTIITTENPDELFLRLKTREFITQISSFEQSEKIIKCIVFLKNNEAALDAFTKFIYEQNAGLRELSPVVQSLESKFIALTARE